MPKPKTTRAKAKPGDKRINNQFWRLATNPAGIPKIFKSPQELWERCCGYFEWVEDHPLMAAETVKFQGVATLTELPKLRAMTIGALSVFLGIDVKTWNNYRNKESYKEFFPIVTQVEEIIRAQKFEGAAAEMFNPNIIAREIGLSEKNEHTGKDGGPMEIENTIIEFVEAAKR
ncbi:MAG: terminase small subunit [Pseudomonadota bacterium]